MCVCVLQLPENYTPPAPITAPVMGFPGEAPVVQDRVQVPPGAPQEPSIQVTEQHLTHSSCLMMDSIWWMCVSVFASASGRACGAERDSSRTHDTEEHLQQSGAALSAVCYRSGNRQSHKTSHTWTSVKHIYIMNKTIHVYTSTALLTLKHS